MKANINLEEITRSVDILLRSRDFKQARDLFLELHHADQAELFNQLDEEYQSILLQNLDVPSTADLFDELEDEDTRDAADFLTIDRLADVVDEMDPDEAADLLGDLPVSQADLVLSQMDDPGDVLPLLDYSDDTAGGRMTTAFINIARNATADQAINKIREAAVETDVPNFLFVTDNINQLVGVSGLREIILSSPDTQLESIMDPDVVSINAQEDQETAARLMAKYDLSSLPVIDSQNKLIGVITHDDILDVIEDEATEDIYRLGNVTDADLEPESPVKEQLRGRLPWLLLNTLTALFASWIISNYEDLFIQVAILAFFQSVVAGQGGNAASQNVAMIVRAIALGKVEVKRVWRILLRQILIGFLQGSVIGLLVGVGVGIWQHNPYLGMVLGFALVGNMVVASIVGTLAPLALKYVGQDPALASSVLVTAITDSLGFLIFLSLAKIFLPLILNSI